MITAICRQPQCGQHWTVSALSTAETHQDAEAIIGSAKCPVCHQPLTPEQRAAFLETFDEVIEMERPADVEYWFSYMMGGMPRGTH